MFPSMSAVMNTPKAASDPKEDEFWTGGSSRKASAAPVTEAHDETFEEEVLDDDKPEEEEVEVEEDETVILPLNRRVPSVPASPVAEEPILPLAKQAPAPVQPIHEENPPSQEEPEEDAVTAEPDVSRLDEPLIMNPKLDEIAVRLSTCS